MPQKASERRRLVPDNPFEDGHHYQDEVHGEIFLNDLEHDAIDTPEFQRLFRISQMGFTHMVYPTANHTRGQHSIGACETAKRLVQRLNANSASAMTELQERSVRIAKQNNGLIAGAPPRISQSEAILIRLGALLHDISQGPFSHEIEKKTHLIYPKNVSGNSGVSNPIKIKSHYGLYEKHDDFQYNPTFFIAIMDTDRSVLARVIEAYSPEFWNLMQEEAKLGEFRHIKTFVDAVNEANWRDVKHEVLSSLLFHLITLEKFPDSVQRFSQLVAVDYGQKDGAPVMREWGLGRNKTFWENLHLAWYQPYRHDIIGNTLSADLVDYLARDARRLGIARGMDLNLLNHYVLAPAVLHSGSQSALKQEQLKLVATATSPTYFRCAIDLNDYKRGTVRDYLLNDVFRMLDLRHEIHEKAVNHRVVQSAVAMLSRSVLILDKQGKKPRLDSVVGLGTGCPAIFGDEAFLKSLMDCAPAREGTMLRSNSLPQKLAERRVFRPLMIVPGDRALSILTMTPEIQDVAQIESVLRRLAAIVDSRFFSPFFLFISACVEEYLEHALDSVEEVKGFISKVAAAKSDSFEVGHAQNIVPKRVIIWAPPYKQLYKDPALLVRVDGKVMEIEKLQTYADSPELKSRTSAAIRDAETKYARLWKLYVFISDSLFYAGTLAKLIKDHECGRKTESHLRCLESAQQMLVSCLRTAYMYWDSKENSTNSLDLASDIDPNEFQGMLKLFLRDMEQVNFLYPNLHRSVSAVDLKLYLHGDDTTSCRDCYYRFDPDASERWDKATREKEAPESPAFKLLSSFGVDKGRLLDREFLEFLERYDAAPQEVKEKVTETLSVAQAAMDTKGARVEEFIEQYGAVARDLYRAELTLGH